MTTCGVCGRQNPDEAQICIGCGGISGRPGDATKRQSLFPVLAGLLLLGALFLGISFWREAHPQLTFFGTDLIATGVLQKAPDYRGQKVPMRRIEAQIREGFVEVPLQVILDAKLVQFYYQSGQYNIPLMAYVGPTGRLITAFAMCEPSENANYHFESNTLVSDKCGSSWVLEGDGPKPRRRAAHLGLGGSCACKHFGPEFIHNEVVDGIVRIPENLIQQWSNREGDPEYST